MSASWSDVGSHVVAFVISTQLPVAGFQNRYISIELHLILKNRVPNEKDNVADEANQAKTSIGFMCSIVSCVDVFDSQE